MASRWRRYHNHRFMCVLLLFWAGGKENGIMKNKILTAVSTMMMFVPPTILFLRSFEWALESPTAEIMISCYLVFMIVSGVFTIVVYIKKNVRNNLMKVCLMINSLYAAVGIVMMGMMINTKLM